MLYEYVFTKFLDTPFTIYRLMPREPLLPNDNSVMGSFRAMVLAVEKCVDSLDPLSYLKEYQVK